MSIPKFGRFISTLYEANGFLVVEPITSTEISFNVRDMGHTKGWANIPRLPFGVIPNPFPFSLIPIMAGKKSYT